MGTARAQTVPGIGPRYRTREHISVVLGPTFFQSLPDEQTLTLLHEFGHVYLDLNGLRGHTIETIDAWHIERDRRLRDDCDDFADAKHDLGFMFRSFVDEVLAEQYLQRRFSAFSGQRRVMYLAMREEIARRGTLDRTHLPLRCYSILYELLRNDLGVTISSGAPERSEFERLGNALQQRLHRECSGADALLLIRPNLLAVDFDSPPYDLRAFEDMWIRVMGSAQQ
jgi:hypothetical protein